MVVSALLLTYNCYARVELVFGDPQPSKVMTGFLGNFAGMILEWYNFLPKLPKCLMLLVYCISRSQPLKIEFCSNGKLKKNSLKKLRLPLLTNLMCCIECLVFYQSCITYAPSVQLGFVQGLCPIDI